jgi:hypothetical protein
MGNFYSIGDSNQCDVTSIGEDFHLRGFWEVTQHYVEKSWREDCTLGKPLRKAVANLHRGGPVLEVMIHP